MKVRRHIASGLACHNTGSFGICVSRCYEPSGLGEITRSYYMQLEKVLRHDSTSALLTEAVDDHNATSDLTRLYQDLNSVKNNVQAFPTEETLKRRASSETTS